MPPPRPRRAPPVSDRVEFRSTVDDAWYPVRLCLERTRKLRVMYLDFSEAADEHFDADQFKSMDEIDKLIGRFRPESVPLQDERCRHVAVGMIVCVCHAFGERDIRFYDAVLDSITREEGKDVCLKDACSCTFVVQWLHGPLAREKTSSGIENICLLQLKGQQMDPMLEHFLDFASRKFEARNSQADHVPEVLRLTAESSRSDLISSNTKVPTCSGGNTEVSVDYKPNTFQSPACNFMETTPKSVVKRPFHAMMGRCTKDVQDLDLGSSKKGKNNHRESYYFFRIKNLEKDLSPSCIIGFIRKHTSVSTVVFILPASSSESYSTGAILVETKENADKLSEFLFSPGHIIMSLRGRPWLVSEKWYGSVEGKMPIYEVQPSSRKENNSIKLKLANKGSKEYEMAEHLLQIHKEFHEHIELLHMTLEREEKETKLPNSSSQKYLLAS